MAYFWGCKMFSWQKCKADISCIAQTDSSIPIQRGYELRKHDGESISHQAENDKLLKFFSSFSVSLEIH